MRILVFGGWGQLGSDLLVAAGTNHEIVRPRHSDVDITNAAAVEAMIRSVCPDSVVNAAAYHRLDQTEQHPDRAFAVNAVGARNVSRAAAASEARCVYVSTDYVFDGENSSGYMEDAPVGPLNVYGASKAAGEWLVSSTDPDAIIVRGSALFGHAGSSGKGGNFVENMLAKATAGEQIRVVEDQFITPTCTRDMAERILLLLDTAAPSGIYHAVNSGFCTWFEFCQTILNIAGLEADLAPRKTSPDGIRRPRCSILLDTKSETLGLSPLRRWEVALQWYLKSRPVKRDNSRQSTWHITEHSSSSRGRA
jgi:dTDP-4-dehydrorhamnose reductase